MLKLLTATTVFTVKKKKKKRHAVNIMWENTLWVKSINHHGLMLVSTDVRQFPPGTAWSAAAEVFSNNLSLTS